MKEIKDWSTCLVHRYTAPSSIGEAENQSSNFLSYIIAHLRLLAPNRTSRTDELRLEATPSGALDAFSCSKSPFWPQIHLANCERAIIGVTIEHLNKLKMWMPWISQFCTNWSKYYPLWISINFCEKFYLEYESFRARHLFRVMAIEALLCSDGDYGRQALKSKLPKLLGWHSDLYDGYHNKLIGYYAPKLMLSDQLIDDVYGLRNKVAHGDQIPSDWTTPCRGGFDAQLSYADVLCEAAGSMLRLIWLRIMSDGLQDIFADKKRMNKFFRE